MTSMMGATKSTTDVLTRSITAVSALPSSISPKAANTRKRNAKRWNSARSGTATRRTDDLALGFTSLHSNSPTTQWTGGDNGLMAETA